MYQCDQQLACFDGVALGNVNLFDLPVDLGRDVGKVGLNLGVAFIDMGEPEKYLVGEYTQDANHAGDK
jgi:hypothetical protein